MPQKVEVIFLVPWIYELRGLQNRLVEIRSGFATQKDAREAGLRVRRVVDCIRFPNPEPLAVIAKESGTAVGILIELAGSRQRLDAHRTAAGHFTYAWQQPVLEALAESTWQDRLLRISAAERAISARLRDPAPFESDERVSLGEALLALRRLLIELEENEDIGQVNRAEHEEHSNQTKEVADEETEGIA